MKIKHVREPPFYRENDEVCQLIRSFKYKDNLNDFCNHIDQVLPLTFNDTVSNFESYCCEVTVLPFLSTQSQLLDWAEVLDRIDGYIAEILQRYLTKLVFVEDQPVTEDSVCKSTEDSAYDSYVSHLKRMLVFTKELLLKTTNKEVYNSADVSFP